MEFFESRINVTSEGVYRPVNLWIDAIGCAIIFPLLARQLYLGKIPLYAAFLFAALAIAAPLFKKIKYGKSGIPYIKASSNELILFLPADSRGKVRFELKNLRGIKIYGRLNRRKYRFLMQDGSFSDISPYFGERAGQAVIHFLVTNLPAQIPVTIFEPQTFFEEVRGEGP